IPTKGESPKIEVKDFNLCPRFTGLIINNITVEESPKWLKDRLKATGHGAHNNIVDVTNFVMAEIGQPMHAFDKNLINKGLIIRPAKPNETLTSLDNKPRKLDPSMCIVADHKNPLAIAGIIGGASSEINPKTTSIILEAANWNAPNLRRTSQKLGVRTDAVQRFEKYLDPTLTELAIKRAAELILKLCPKAQIAGPITDVKDPKKKNLISPYPTKIDLNLLKTKSKIGVDIKEPEIKKILTSLHFKPIKKSKDTLAVQIPSFRATKDVSQEDDLIEEIARIYGFENIPPSLPLLPTNLPKENSERFKKHRARELFSYGLGFNEVSNYSFYGEADFKKCLMTEEGHLKLQKFLSEDQTRLRTSLIPHLLRNLQLNIKYTDCISIYEIGRTYKDLGEYFPLEEKFIGGAILKKEKTNDPFYKAKGAVESFFEKFNFTKIKEVKGVKSAPYAHPTKSQSYIDQNGQTIAKVFCLHPEVQKTHELDAYSIALFEINFTEALKLPQKEKKFKELPRFPGISLDISVLVDRTREVNDIKNAITSANKELIKDTSLFDIYEGDKIEKGKKAVAFTVFLQSNDRTLTEEDMTQTQNKIFQNLTKIGGKVRGA
ncbi:MAG: phenylalanine--tRNA ligase subunit beta, partial [Candidatus Peregrinibacteria bacterium]